MILGRITGKFKIHGRSQACDLRFKKQGRKRDEQELISQQEKTLRTR